MRGSIFGFFLCVLVLCVAPSLCFAQQNTEPESPKSVIMNIGSGIRKQMRGLVVEDVSKDMKDESFHSPYIENGRKNIQNFILGNGYIQRRMLENISIIPDHLRQGMMEKSRNSPDKGMSGIRSIARDLLYNVTLYYVGNTQSQLRILQVMPDGSTQGAGVGSSRGLSRNSPRVPVFSMLGNGNRAKPSLEETQEELETSQVIANPFATQRKTYSKVDNF